MVDSRLTRRRFLASTSVAAAGLALAGPAVAAEAPEPDPIHLAIIGAGTHGRQLLQYCIKIPGVRFKAVCDIWPFSSTYASRLLAAYKQPVEVYEDYREMLAKEKDLDAAIVATPDAFHADQTVACLEAGLHVYCEKEMHHTIAGARRIVQAARKADRLVQVGRQHRSNPRYHTALEYIDTKKALGRIVHVAGQWHGHQRVPYKWKEKYAADEAVLKKYGFESMQALRDWRWSKQFSAGPMANLGSHQVDVFNWFLHVPPKAVMASAGRDYYDFYDWYDTITCIFEWDYAWNGETKTVRGDYDIVTMSEDEGFFEVFTGEEGGLTISEHENKGGLRREKGAPYADWEKALKGDGRTYPPIPYPGEPKPVHRYHLENFFDAIRGTAKLTCPAEVGFVATVTALKANEAAEAGRRLDLTPDDFKV
jgi:predicted dehydrogenase